MKINEGGETTSLKFFGKNRPDLVYLFASLSLEGEKALGLIIFTHIPKNGRLRPS